MTVTIATKTMRLRLGVMGGRNLIGLSKANREEPGVDIGDPVEAAIELDAAARAVDVPADAATALAKAKLRKPFDALAFTHQKEHLRAITEAKKPETRLRRIAAMLEKLRGGDRACVEARGPTLATASPRAGARAAGDSSR